MKKQLNWKKKLSALLCVAVLATSMPSMAFAAEDESALSEQSVESIQEEVTAANVAFAEEEASAIESASVDSSVDNDELFEEYVNQLFFGADTSASTSTKNKLRKSSARANLSEYEQIVYDTLKEGAAAIASGERASSIFEIPITDLGGQMYTAEELGLTTILNDSGKLSDEAKAAIAKNSYVDVSAVIHALMADCPYELYWFDKTSGYSRGYPSITYSLTDEGPAGYVKDGSLTIYMAVAGEYSDGSYTTIGGENMLTGTDVNVTGAASAAAANAQDIVAENASLSDYDKLTTYKDTICDLTDYNQVAVDNDADYGNPWQLIWVFDGDTDTAVVCEGYSKAFQYLCDQSEFSADIECITVTGTMSGGTGAGGHMWNIVHMDDNRNYLVDVTNCDYGTIGYPDSLFFKGYSQKNTVEGEVETADGTVSYTTSEYVFTPSSRNISYVYDYDTVDLYSEEDLTLSATEYVPSVVYDDSHHYLAFASDRHDQPAAVAEAMSAIASEYEGQVEYVSLIGDMTGSGSMGSSRYAPAFNTSTVFSEIQAVFPWLTTENVSIVFGGHDAGATDDANILKCWNPDQPLDVSGYSAPIYTGYNMDGSIAYYIYGIAYDDMLNTSGKAQEMAEEFKIWADGLENPTAPIIVLCHVPIHAKRGDNFGATYWNDALNYAATGSENGTVPKRSVVFFHGHNHTNDTTEYYYEPGDALSVQIQSGNGRTAQGVTEPIYYTYITAGYLKSGTTKNTTLVDIAGENINFTKYRSGSPSQLGTATPYYLVTDESISMAADTMSGELSYTLYKYGEQVNPDDVSFTVQSDPDDIIDSLSENGALSRTGNGGTATITIQCTCNDNVLEETVAVTAEAHTHHFGDVTYTWSDDNKTVTAEHTCSVCNHTETETVDVAIDEKAASCTEKGVTTYTATFKDEGFETQTKSFETVALGHNWDTENISWIWSADYQTATLSISCKNDATHKQTVNATVTSNTTTPTCTTAGKTVHKATATFGGKTYTDTKEVTILALGHDWSDITYTWSDDYKKVTATRICANDSSHVETETVDATYKVTKAATETEAGVGTWTSAEFKNTAFAVQTKEIVLPPYGYKVTYIWSKTMNGYDVTATAVPYDTTAETITETVSATYAITTKPTCTQAGVGTWTSAAFKSEKFAVQTKEVEIAAFGHDWDTENIVWTWAKDYSSATATITCKNDAAHKQIITASVTSSTTAAACETAGKNIYTATAVFDGKTYTDTQEVALPAIGHDWGEVTYIWSDDYKTVQAKRVCKNDSSHIEQEFAATTAAVTKAATCEEKGETTYTATFKNAAFSEQTKTVANIDAIGHDWDTKNIDWTWSSDNGSATATFTCKNDSAHKQTVNATVTSKTIAATCETAGKTVYTATVKFEGSTYTDTKEVTIPATGHKWSDVTYIWSDDYKNVTAIRTCANDDSHVETETVDATYKVTTAATETEAGIGTWTSAAFKNSAFTVQTKEVTIAPYGYKVSYEWIETADGYNVKGTAVPYDTAADTITETVSATYAVTTAPTCTEAGVGTWTSAAFKNSQFAVQTKEVEIAASGHEWGDVTYTWANDYKSVTAKRVCKNDATHIEQETAATTATVTKAAACEEKGETTYTATFKNTAFAIQTKTVADIAALGHDWDTKNIEWIWTSDNSSVTATITCANDATHKQTVNATVTSKTTAATCETAGKTVYTATVKFEGSTYTDTKEVVIPATGHKWGEATYIWSTDYKTVTAKRVCKNDDSHIEQETAATTATVTKAATCTEKGETTYTATFKNAAFAKQTKTVADIVATGHDWDTKNIEWTWSADNGSATAMITCKNDATHQQTVNATITSATTAATCETAGKKVYTATATFDGKTYTDTQEVTLPATGHKWGKVTYIWSNDYKTVQAKRVCENDSSHIEQEFAATTAAVTKAATCEEKGETTYTATFKNAAFSEQTKTVANIDAIGHDWDTKNISWTWVANNSSATATITCANDATHKQIINATVTRKTTAATCETAGKTVYTATVSFAGSTYTDTKEVAIPATGHKWSEVTYTWSDDYKKVTATRVCANDANHVESETVDATYKVTTPATETEAGIGTWTSAAFKNNAFAVQTKEVLIPPYGFKVTYEWIETADGYNVKGTAIPNDTSADTITETVSATYAVTTAPTCTEAGIGTWTSTEFKNSQFAVQTKEVEISALDHDWSDATYTWSVDYKTVTAKRVCENDDSHIEQETATTTAAVTKAATCEEKGETKYTAAFKNTAFAVQTKTVADIEATGHDWDTKNIEWTWSSDNSSVTATITCANDATHKQIVNATVTSKTTAATCETAGKTVYIATVEFEGSTYIDTKEVAIPATGHDWGEVTYTWADGYKTVQAKRVCKNDSHIEQEFAATTATVTKEATCEEKGETTYTATFKNAAFAEQTKTVADIAALGHDYELAGWTWTSDNGSATATFTCKNDSAHKQTVNATVTNKTTAATCETAGKTVYTATVKFEGSTYTDTKEVVIPATGHTWGKAIYTWSDDYKKVTAKRTCTNDANHVETETVDATYKVTTPATETEAGVGTWTSAAFKNSAFAVQTKEVTIPPYGFKVTYEWIETADGYNVKGTAIPNDTSADTITETVSATYAVTTEPTCTAKGIGTWTSAAFKNSQFAVQTKEVEIDALGHDWDTENIDWTWSSGNSSATATIICTNDATHKQTVNAVVTSKKTAATCETAGKTVYTAIVSFEGSTYTDTKEVAIPATGHKWGNVTYTWSDDYKKVTATRTCTNDANHVETETVDVTYKVIKEATCSKAGVGTWTSAVFKNSAFTVQTKTVEIAALGHDYKTEVTAPTCIEKGYTTHTCIRCGDSFVDSYVDALGHDFELTGWTWTSHNGSATATFTCNNDTTHKQTVNAPVTSKTIATTCETAGKTVYTASATFEGKTYTDTREVAIPATGHTWGKAIYTWSDDYKKVTATRTCTNNANHVETETVDATYKVTTEPTCTAKGIGTWTSAEFKNSQFTVQTKDVEIDALGHDYKTEVTAPTCTEKGYTTHTCTRCGDNYVDNYVDTIDHTWNQGTVTTEPTYLKTGLRTYTCTSCGETKTETIPKKTATKKWIQEEGEWYYFNAESEILTNGWAKDSTGWCWMGADGKITKSKWITYNGEWYYLKANGYMAANEWTKDSKGWMWMDGSGKITKSKWITYNGEWYYLKANGYMAANEWAKDSKGWMWMDGSGKITKNKWIKYNGEWYYLKANGYMAANEYASDSTKTYWMGSDGKISS